MTVVLCVTCLIAAFVAAKLFAYDMGTAAGLLAGAFTESTVIGTAGDAINRLDLPPEQKTALINNIPVAYAVTYLIGTAFIVWFLPNMGPRLMGVNLKEEAKKHQSQSGAPEEQGPGVQSAFTKFAVRAYRVSNEQMIGKTVATARGAPQGRARLHLAHPSRRDHRPGPTRHRHPQGRRGRGHDPVRGLDGARHGDRPGSG